MEDFALSTDQEKEIMRLAIQYKKEAKKCFGAKAYLSGCVLMGAAMEAILLSTVNCFPAEIVASTKYAPKKKCKIKRLDEWKLNELLAVAKESNLLPSGLSSEDEWNSANAKIGDYVDVVRKIRNLIHPVRYLDDFGRKKFTKKYLKACFEIVDTAIDYLSFSVKNSLSIMLDEKERRSAQSQSGYTLEGYCRVDDVPSG